MQKPFVVLRTRGSSWDDSRSMDEQTDWPAHAAFMDSLVAQRFVVIGGPLEGTRDVLLVIQAERRTPPKSCNAFRPIRGHGMVS